MGAEARSQASGSSWGSSSSTLGSKDPWGTCPAIWTFSPLTEKQPRARVDYASGACSQNSKASCSDTFPSLSTTLFSFLILKLCFCYLLNLIRKQKRNYPPSFLLINLGHSPGRQLRRLKQTPPPPSEPLQAAWGSHSFCPMGLSARSEYPGLQSLTACLSQDLEDP